MPLKESVGCMGCSQIRRPGRSAGCTAGTGNAEESAKGAVPTISCLHLPVAVVLLVVSSGGQPR